MADDPRKQMKLLMERLTEAGCTVEQSGGGHYKIKRDGKTFSASVTPSGGRAVLDAYADARRILGVQVYMRGGPNKKRKDSVDDFSMSRLRERVSKEMRRGVTISDLARLAVAVPRERGNPTWKTHGAAAEGIRLMMHDPTRRLTRVRHDALAAALNKIEHADDKALKKHLDWAAEFLDMKRISGHAVAPTPTPGLEPAKVVRLLTPPSPEPPAPEPEPFRTEAEDDARTIVVRVELGPDTRSLIRELVGMLR